MTTAAFYYVPDGYETKREKLLGRHAAGESFLYAYVQYSQQDKLYCYAQNRKNYDHFLTKVRERLTGAKMCSWISWGNWAQLREPGCLFYPGPVLKDLAWQRRHLAPNAFSLCGITHTTATKGVMDAVGDLLTAPLHSWDAIICTSEAVKAMVQEILDNYAVYLQELYSLPAPPKTQVQLPVIPLGLNISDFAKPDNIRDSLRRQWRAKLNMSDEDVAFLFVGRLASHAKAHPVPMFLALEEAANSVKQRLHLILAGWFPTKLQQQEFVESAKEFCPHVIVHIADGRNAEVRSGIWYAADVFTSLSDNVQETFGLTPIEGMAAGLPCVVSDWDGYKETVREGIDGFRIPTWMAPPGPTLKLAIAHASSAMSYDEYIGTQGQFTSVDVHAAGLAYARLAANKDLRLKMGNAAQKRATESFDWQSILKSYHSLWEELAERRAHAVEIKQPSLLSSVSPLRDDPGRLFQAYPSCSLTPQTLISKRPDSTTERVTRLKHYAINRVADGIAGESKEVAQLLGSLPEAEVSINDLMANTVEPLRAKLVLNLLWLSKMGLINLRNK